MSGLFELAPRRPWGFDLGFSVYGRQGYASPPFLPVTPTDGVARELALTAFDAFRNADGFVVNLGGYKTWTLGRTEINVGIEGFNLLGTRAAVQRELDQSRPNAGAITETVSPRVLRIGARLSFR